MREKLISDFLRGPTRSGEQARSMGGAFFRDVKGFGRLDGGSRTGFTSSRHLPPWASAFIIPYFCMICGLEKLVLEVVSYLVMGIVISCIGVPIIWLGLLLVL